MTDTGTVASGLVELIVGGMTCSSCAARIERQLNRLDGVTATVSYATERAYVTSAAGRDHTELIRVIEAAGYTARPAPHVPDDQELGTRPTQMLGRRLVVCVPLAVATILLAMVPAAQFPGWQWVSLVLAGPVAIWGAWPLHRTAWKGLGNGAATMDTLVSLGVSASFCWSLYALLFRGAGSLGMRMPFSLAFGPVGSDALYFEAAAGVTAAVLAGRYLEARAKSRSGATLTTLASLGAKTVAVLRDGTEERVAVETLAVGDEFVVRPGEKIATDGTVLEGSSAVDSSMVTGESVPAEVGPGDEVTGATVNMSGRILVRATRVGADTVLAQIAQLVSHALATKAGAQRMADKVAAVFVPCVISLAVVTLGFWLGVGLPAAAAWSDAVAVLVVACPCALGLATPTALLAGLGRGAELGILVKSAHALERAGQIHAVVLDKTGTLTTGIMTMQQISTAPGVDEQEVLLLAGAVEDASEHPIGQAIATAAASRLGELPRVTDFTSLPGAGVRGTAGGRTVTVGSPQLLAEAHLAIPRELDQAVDAAGAAGRTAVLAGWDGQARAVFEIGDAVRPGSAAAVASIKSLRLLPMLITGDSMQVATAVAAEVGIPPENVFAGFSPAGKVRAIKELQASKVPVAMVGDGINDAAALAQADLGVAIGSGTDVAIGAADVTLVNGDPGSICDAVQLARATHAVIGVNLTWAFGYNLIAIPLAAIGYLKPLFAGIAMSASSLIVVSNSLLLRRFRPRRAAMGLQDESAGVPDPVK
jgi:P-type Cu+ transporter